MSVLENARVRIKPGNTVTLFEKLGVTEFSQGAGVMLAEYMSNRSVALLLRPEGGLYVGSGVCLQIANHYLVATAKHNLQHEGRDLEISDFEVRTRGQKYGEPLRVLRKGLCTDLDLAWLELAPQAQKEPYLAFATLDQVSSFQENKGQQACSLLGYPAEMADTPSDAQQRPFARVSFRGDAFNHPGKAAKSAGSQDLHPGMASWRS
jgi:hypothetical protein